MNKMAVRPTIQIDCGPELRNKLKVLALQNNVSLRVFILNLIAEKYPEVAGDVKDELARQLIG